MFSEGVRTAIEMETLDDGSPLYGVETDGNCNIGDRCEIIVKTADSITWNFGGQGDLFVRQEAVAVRNHQLLGGELGDTIFRLSFLALDEDIDVTDIRFVGGNNLVGVDRFELYRKGETNKFAEATKGGCQSDPGDYCANMEAQQLVIPDGDEVTVLVRPRMKTDDQGGVSGAQFSIGLKPQNSIEARGVDSSNQLTDSDNDGIAEGEIFIGQDTASSNNNESVEIWSNEHTSVLAKIVSITNANPDPNGSAVPTGVSAIGQFKFAAANHDNSKNGHNDAIVNKLRFNVNGTNVAIDADSFKLYNKSDPTVRMSCEPYYIGGEPFTFSNISGTYTVLCDGIGGSNVDSEINKGDNITLVLVADILNPNVAVATGGVSVLQVSISEFEDPTLGNASHIEWIDRDQATNVPFMWVEYPETSVKSTSYNS